MRQNDTLKIVFYQEIQHRKNSHSKNFLSFSFIFHIPRGKNEVQEEEKNWAARNEEKEKNEILFFPYLYDEEEI